LWRPKRTAGSMNSRPTARPAYSCATGSMDSDLTDSDSMAWRRRRCSAGYKDARAQGCWTDATAVCRTDATAACRTGATAEGCRTGATAPGPALTALALPELALPGVGGACCCSGPLL
jgi:hypothetical protein